MSFDTLIFIGNSDFEKCKKKRMFTEHMLDKHAFGHGKKTKEMLEDIKTFFSKFVVKRVVFI